MSQKCVVFASVAAKHNAQKWVVSVGCAPILHLHGLAGAYTACGVVHLALGVRRVQKHTSQAVSRGHAVFAYTLPISTCHPYIAQTIIKMKKPIKDELATVAPP